MKKQSRDRRAKDRRDTRLREGRASAEDISLDLLYGWNRAKLRNGNRWLNSRLKSLMMDDFQHADYCVRDWVPQLIHKGRKP